MTMDYAENTRRCLQYIEALEEERRKIQVFHRELPLSLHIISQAIDIYRQQMATESMVLGRSDCEEASSGGHPLLEMEFIPLKSTSVSSEKEVEETHQREENKPDWLRSVQLWNQNSHPPADEESSKKPPTVVEMKNKAGGAFHPFRGEKKTSASAAAASSTAETGSRSRPQEEKEGRKARRCWSPELHRSFLNALQQLGGPDVATPKQIKELMKVEGLTNDEVKSHLQKYRLHTRRPGAAMQGCSSSTAQPSAQFLVVGGIWVPPAEYPMATRPIGMGMETTPVYSPVPSSVQKEEKEPQKSPAGPLHWTMGRSISEEEHANSASPATSSSSHTTTSSPSPAF